MIVNTHGKQYIHSAFVEHTNLGKLLIINTTEKGLHPHTIISGYIDKDKYGVRFEYKYKAFVELLAENKEEENFLSKSMRFENTAKIRSMCCLFRLSTCIRI